jgi:hypothetical protein
MQIGQLWKEAFESFQREGRTSVVRRIGECHADELLPDRLCEGSIDSVEGELSDGLSRHFSTSSLDILCRGSDASPFPQLLPLDMPLVDARRPVRPYIGTDVSALVADHARADGLQLGVSTPKLRPT